MLLRVVTERAPDLGEHVVGVARDVLELGSEMELDGRSLEVLVRAAALHDIGKVALPDALLRKPGPLNKREWALMRRHTLIGERILCGALRLRPVAKLVRSSHERWDGSGYPDGLAGREIPLGARIIFVCDAFEAMLEQRAYRSAVSVEEALTELRANAGTQFDPAIVERFVSLAERRYRSRERERARGGGAIIPAWAAPVSLPTAPS